MCTAMNGRPVVPRLREEEKKPTTARIASTPISSESNQPELLSAIEHHPQ